MTRDYYGSQTGGRFRTKTGAALILPFPAAAELAFPFGGIEGDVIDLDDAVIAVAWVMYFDIRCAGAVTMGLADLLGLSPDDIYREVVARCRFPRPRSVH
jgi:hypothetical protein